MVENLTIKSFLNGLARKDFSVFEVTSEFLRNIEERDKKVKAFLSVFKEEALNESREIDRQIFSSGFNPEDIFPISLAVKDNILIKEKITTASSRILENYKSAYDATVIKKLKEKKCIFIGKTNLDEFAMGSSTENSAFGPTKNPLNLEVVPGGSSGGSAAAVASGEALAALGSDTGGSIRQPAAFCGVVGLKPTYGSVSRFGLIAMASSLDQIGPITRTVEDAEILFQKICGKDKFDATSANFHYKPLNLNKEDIRGLKIGLPKEYFVSGLDKNIESGVNFAIRKLEKLGCVFKEISLPHTKYALSVYYILMPAEVSANLARFDGIRYERIINSKSLKEIYFENRGEGFGKEARRRILLGTFVLSAGYYDAYYSKAQKVRGCILNEIEEAFKEVDIILSPVTPSLPFKFGEKTSDPIQMYLSDVFTIPANLSGIPALSLPTGFYKDGLPVGFQIMANRFEENKLLSLGKIYEEFE